MTERCFDEGTLQAFLDGELAPEFSPRVARHVSGCDSCAMLLADVEQETSFVFAEMDREFNTLVPTQRLWTKINDSIGTGEHRPGLWPRFAAFISGLNLTSPAVAAFGSLLLVFVSFAVLIGIRQDQGGLAVVPAPSGEPAAVSSAPRPVQTADARPVPSAGSGDRVVSLPGPAPETVGCRSNSRTPRPAEGTRGRNMERLRPQPAVLRYLPGEESFISTIASLEKTVESRKEEALRPSMRFNYEKNLAVVDDAIEKMKAEVRKNPRNEAARQVLFASYQNKIDLLSSVAEKSELMATLR
jgi:hypothetical protein